MDRIHEIIVVEGRHDTQQLIVKRLRQVVVVLMIKSLNRFAMPQVHEVLLSLLIQIHQAIKSAILLINMFQTVRMHLLRSVMHVQRRRLVLNMRIKIHCGTHYRMS